EPAARGVDDLLGDRAICGDLPAEDREDALHAFALGVVEERVLARDLSFAHAFLANESAHPRPREMNLVERRARKSATRLILQIPHVLLGRLDAAGVAGVVGVRRAH